MNKTIHTTDKAPAPVGPYSQAVEVDGWIFCSGQIPLDADSGELLKGPIPEQTHKVMANIKAVLDAAKLDFSNIIKTTIFLRDMNDFAAMNEVYARYFTEQPPARSCVQAARLPKDVDVEIEVIAKR